MKNSAELFVLGMLVVAAVIPQNSQAQTVITTPPRSLQPQPETGGMDATLQANVQANVTNSSITLPLGGNPPAPAPAPAPPSPAPDPSICMANGGMPYTITPVTIKSGGYSASGVAIINGHSTSRWNATGGYTATIAFDGTSVTVTDPCTRANSTDGIDITDACDHSSTVAVGRGTFIIAGSYTSPVTGDWVRGTNAPYYGKGTVTQTNCD